MARWLVTLVGCGLLGQGLVRAVPLRGEKDALTLLDLQPKANAKLKEAFHGGLAGNDLSAVPQGTHKFAGVKFEIGKGLIQLAGKNDSPKPAKVEGIKVGKKFTTLYILHATGTGYQTPVNTVVAKFLVHYKDKTKAAVEIAYGKDVLDWWYYPKSPTVTRGKVAWTGDNPAAKKSGAKVRLYLTTWKNPHPKKEVSHIDFLSTRTTIAQPFCVALTVAGK
jgi:hypothetical protein